MAAYGAAQLRAAVEGRAALEGFLAATDFDPEYFTTEDHAALGGLGLGCLPVVRRAMASGPGPHGRQDRVIPYSHDEWLARHCPLVEVWERSDDEHISGLNSAVNALDWLREHPG